MSRASNFVVAAIEAVQALDIGLTITEPQYQLDGRYLSNRSGCMRIDVFMAARLWPGSWDALRS